MTKRFFLVFLGVFVSPSVRETPLCSRFNDVVILVRPLCILFCFGHKFFPSPLNICLSRKYSSGTPENLRSPSIPPFQLSFLSDLTWVLALNKPGFIVKQR